MTMHIQRERQIRRDIQDQVDELSQQPREVLEAFQVSLANFKRFCTQRDARLDREHMPRVKHNEIGD